MKYMIEKYRSKQSGVIVEAMQIISKPSITKDILDFGEELITSAVWAGGGFAIRCTDGHDILPFERIFPCAFGEYLVKYNNCIVALSKEKLEKHFYPSKEDNISQRPPLGLLPRRIFIEKRIQDIKDAIHRYSESNKEIPTEWTEEYNDLIKQVNGK